MREKNILVTVNKKENKIVNIQTDIERESDSI